jgi:hypothetical protein
MKRVKFTILSLLCALALIVPSAAYAWPGADTRATAAPITSVPMNVTSYLTSPSDVDWYRWTNNTGVTKTVMLQVFPMTINGNFNIYSEIINTDASVNVVGYAADNGVGNHDQYTIMVYPGQTLLYRIDRGYDGSVGTSHEYFNSMWFIGG